MRLVLPAVLAVILMGLPLGCTQNTPPPQPVSLNDLPKSVRAGFVRDFPNVKLESVERVPQKDGRVFYRLHYVGENGRKDDILYNPEGYRETKNYDLQHSG